MVLVATCCLFLLLFHRRDRVDMVPMISFWILEHAARVLTKKLVEKRDYFEPDDRQKMYYFEHKGYYFEPDEGQKR